MCFPKSPTGVPGGANRMGATALLTTFCRLSVLEAVNALKNALKTLCFVGVAIHRRQASLPIVPP